jgi:coenzyme F420-0:L-glutamate ligase/coenzyme F420-1:gamma-L-glutamate ligase
VRHALGHVLANAGIDASNVQSGAQGETVLLVAQGTRRQRPTAARDLEAHFRVRLAVVIADSLGRAWRMGTIGTAIGSAGLQPLRDRRG